VSISADKTQIREDSRFHPFADGALNFISIKSLEAFLKDGYFVKKRSIAKRVNPKKKKRLLSPWFSGIIYITENDWRIHSLDLTIGLKTSTKNWNKYLDTLQIPKIHVGLWIVRNIGRVLRKKNQVLHFNF